MESKPGASLERYSFLAVRREAVPTIKREIWKVFRHKNVAYGHYFIGNEPIKIYLVEQIKEVRRKYEI